MTDAPMLALQFADWLALFLHTLSLSLISIGGVVTVLPAMHTFLVQEHGWITPEQFSASYAMAQAAPGPNVQFLAMFGWMIGMNSASLSAGCLAIALMMAGMMIPCTTLAYFASRWIQNNRQKPSVRAFRQGMMPIVIALMFATAWIMSAAYDNPAKDWPLWVLTIVSALIVWRTKVHLLWLLLAGALLGGLGLA